METIYLNDNGSGIFEAVLQNQAANLAKAAEPTTPAENLFGWEIKQMPIYDELGRPIETHKRIIRDDNGGLLNVTNASYTPTYNTRFSESVRKMEAYTGFKLSQVAEFNEGKKVIAFLESPEITTIADHRHRSYILIGNAHDGSSAFFMGLTSHMIRCANQFTQRNQQLKAHHTRGINGALWNLEQGFRDHQEQQRTLKATFERLALKPATNNATEVILRTLLDIKPGEQMKDLSGRKKNLAVALTESIMHETAEVGRNMFGIFAGVTHYTTHSRKSEAKSFGNVFGTDYDLNRKALNVLQEL